MLEVIERIDEADAMWMLGDHLLDADGAARAAGPDGHSDRPVRSPCRRNARLRRDATAGAPSRNARRPARKASSTTMPAGSRAPA